MNRVLFAVGLAAFASSLFLRMTDPIVPPIATDLGVDVHQVALLGTAFALPWALMQPVLGPLGDLVGKTRVITVSLAVLIVTALAGAFAPDFRFLLASRILSGIVGGGVFPVAMALIGDLVPLANRQVAIARLLTASIVGILLGASASGVVADIVGWRGVFVVVAGIATLALAAVLIGLRGVPVRRASRISFMTVTNNYRQVFANPKAKYCYAAVFIEGVTVFGIFPFVATFIAATGEQRSSIAGIVIGAFAIGGIFYTFSARPLVARFSLRALMIAGGAAAAAGLIIEAALPPWPVQILALGLTGFGFYLLHATIQVQMTELAPDARGTAVSMHSFSYFLGQAVGPVLYGAGLAVVGVAPTLVICAVIIAATGPIIARLLLAPAPAKSA
jgi:DHA1 family inner membrane transport protein